MFNGIRLSNKQGLASILFIKMPKSLKKKRDFVVAVDLRMLYIIDRLQKKLMLIKRMVQNCTNQVQVFTWLCYIKLDISLKI